MRAAKRDANEREMVEAWRALGALWIPQTLEAGFDGVLLFQGKTHYVEVKAIRHEKYTLTANEQRASVLIERRGGHYAIVTNMAEALALVGAE
jgi:hypothetical protein